MEITTRPYGIEDQDLEERYERRLSWVMDLAYVMKIPASLIRKKLYEVQPDDDIFKHRFHSSPDVPITVSRFTDTAGKLTVKRLAGLLGNY